MEIGGLSMVANFREMTMRELKNYVLEHREDREAFEALMDRVDAQPKGKIYGKKDAAALERFSSLLEQHQRISND
jgi:hypothetical protein